MVHGRLDGKITVPQNELDVLKTVRRDETVEGYGLYYVG
jgi:hypothetical protein